MRFSDFTKSLQITDRGHQYTARAGEGFNYDCRDTARMVARNNALKIIREVGTPGGLAFAKCLMLRIVGFRKMEYTRKQGPSRNTVVADTTNTRTTKSRTVIPTLPPYQPGPLAFPTRVVIPQCNFECGINRFRSRVSKENGLQALGHHVR